jgi:anti-sigma regulatory factor (Ser/Thr protein kinase)
MSKKPKSMRSARRPSLTLAGTDRLVFGQQVLHQDATLFRRLMYEAKRERKRGFTFDFKRTQFAAPVAMAQLVIQADACRQRGMHFDVIGPVNPKTRGVFEHSNWAHHLSPVNYEPNDRQSLGWLPVARYRTDEQLLGLVNRTCEVVLRETDVRRSALHGLEWALNEIADNVFQHADASDGGLVAVTVPKGRRRVQFVVADAGSGIPTTIRTGHPGLSTDLSAVRHALQQGVTRDRSVGAGNGLAGTLRIATAAGGSFTVHSARALMHADGKNQKPTGRTYSPDAALEGTVVYFEIPVNHEVDLEAVLLQDGIGIADWDYLDTTYQLDESDARLLVKDEATSTATRIAGRPVRVKAENLIGAHSDAKVVLDFKGIDRVTASFADEVVGKLFANLGPSIFTKRIVIEGIVDKLVRGQVGRTMGQRRAEGEDRERKRENREIRRQRREARRSKRR